MQEEKVSSSCYFITLTYDTSSVPISTNGFMELSKRDVQLFFKRLRKLHVADYGKTGMAKLLAPESIRYFAVGEYGSKKSRPHYHVIIFNTKPELIDKAWSLDGKPIGTVYFGTVTEASVGYTLKYMMKEPGKKKHSRDDRQPEFRLMSKSLGANYLSANMVAWHLDDLENRMYCNIPGGKKISMPRYYKQKIYDSDQTSIISDAMRKKINEKVAKEELQHGDDYVRFKSQEKIAAYRKMYADAERDRNKI